MGESTRVAAEGMSWDRVIGELEERLVEMIDCRRTEHRREVWLQQLNEIEAPLCRTWSRTLRHDRVHLAPTPQRL